MRSVSVQKLGKYNGPTREKTYETYLPTTINLTINNNDGIPIVTLVNKNKRYTYTIVSP